MMRRASLRRMHVFDSNNLVLSKQFLIGHSLVNCSQVQTRQKFRSEKVPHRRVERQTSHAQRIGRQCIETVHTGDRRYESGLAYAFDGRVANIDSAPVRIGEVSDFVG